MIPRSRERGPSPKTLRAIERVRAGSSAYRAARDEGIALSTIYRALKRAAFVGSTDEAVTDFGASGAKRRASPD